MAAAHASASTEPASHGHAGVTGTVTAASEFKFKSSRVFTKPGPRHGHESRRWVTATDSEPAMRFRRKSFRSPGPTWPAGGPDRVSRLRPDRESALAARAAGQGVPVPGPRTGAAVSHGGGSTSLSSHGRSHGASVNLNSTSQVIMNPASDTVTPMMIFTGKFMAAS